MRFTTLTVCSLTVLLAGGISAQANEIPSSQVGTEPLLVQDNVTMPIVLESSVLGTDKPATLIDTQKKSAQEIKTVAEAKPEVLIESPKQAEPPLVGQAGVEALRPKQAIVAQSSTNPQPSHS